MGERQGQDIEQQLRQGIVKQASDLMSSGRKDVYRLSRIEKVGVFHIPEEFIWRYPSFIFPEDRHRLFTDASVHVATRHPLRLVQEEQAQPRKRLRKRQEASILEIPGSTIVTLSLAYPNEWRTKHYAETLLHLEGEQVTLARSRKVEVPEAWQGNRRLCYVTLYEEPSRVATTEETQVFSGMLRYVKQVHEEQERIAKADTGPLRIPLMSTDPPIYRL